MSVRVRPPAPHPYLLILRALTTRMRRSIQDQAWSTSLDAIRGIKSLIASECLTPAGVVRTPDLTEQLKKLKNCGPKEVVEEVTGLLLNAFTARMRRSFEAQAWSKVLDTVTSVESLIESDYLLSSDVWSSTSLIRLLEELRNHGPNDVVTAVTRLFTVVVPREIR